MTSEFHDLSVRPRAVEWPNPPNNRPTHAVEPTDDDDFSDINFFGEDGADFWDLVDVINPLQHIPFINTLYREITGDEIGHLARVAGATLFFGPIGGGVALANAVMDETTGHDLGEHVLMAMGVVDDDDEELGDTLLSVRFNNTEDQFFDLENDVVSKWARQELGHTGIRQPPASETDDPLPSISSNPILTAHEAQSDDVMIWAANEVAWFEGAPVLEAHAQPQPSGPTPNPDGAVAPLGGWFTEVGLTDWVRREALLRQEVPSHRPDLAVAAYQAAAAQ